MILILRDEDKWIESFRKFFEAEQKDFAEMKWHRLYGHLYRFIFPHTGRPMRVYMDFLRSLEKKQFKKIIESPKISEIRKKWRKHLKPIFNSRAVGVRYCIGCRYGRCVAIRVFLHFAQRHQKNV